MAISESIGANLSLDEIDRLHRLGKLRGYSKSAQLRSNGQSGWYKNEDLTQFTVYSVRKLKRDRCVQDAWSSGGSILVKDLRGKIHANNSFDDIYSYRHRSYADVA